VSRILCCSGVCHKAECGILFFVAIDAEGDMLLMPLPADKT